MVAFFVRHIYSRLERVAHGIYTLKIVCVDAMYLLRLRRHQIVFCANNFT